MYLPPYVLLWKEVRMNIQCLQKAFTPYYSTKNSLYKWSKKHSVSVIEKRGQWWWWIRSDSLLHVKMIEQVAVHVRSTSADSHFWNFYPNYDFCFLCRSAKPSHRKIIHCRTNTGWRSNIKLRKHPNQKKHLKRNIQIYSLKFWYYLKY